MRRARDGGGSAWIAGLALAAAVAAGALAATLPGTRAMPDGAGDTPIASCSACHDAVFIPASALVEPPR